MQGTDQFADKKINGLGYFVLTALLVLAGAFYQERTLFIDIAYQTFLMITEGTVQVMVYRFGAAIVQALPLLAIKLNAPLWMVSLLYSVAFPLVFLFFYWLIIRVFKNDYLGLIFVCLYTLLVFDAFYWATSEYQQGMGFLLVFFAFVRKYPSLDRWQYWLFLVPGTVALVYYHPLVFLLFLYVWFFFFLHDKKHRHWKYGLLVVWVIGVVLFKSKFSGNWYDDAKYDTFLNNLVDYFPNYWALDSNQQFLHNLWKLWYFFPVALLVVLGYYIYQKKWLKLGLVIFSCLGYLFLIHVGSPNASYRFYIEVNYMALTILVMIPVVYDVLPAIRNQQWVFYAFILFFLIRLASIFYNHQPYTDRLHWLADRLEEGDRQSTTNRYWMPLEKAPTDTLLMTWGVAYESLLLSAMEHPDSAKTLVILPDPQRFDKELQADGFFVSELISYPVEEVDGPYFRLGESQYVKIK